MKKVTSLAIVGLFAIACLGFTGCGPGGEARVVEVEKTPPPALNQVQMEDYAKQMQGQGQPGN